MKNYYSLLLAATLSLSCTSNINAQVVTKGSHHVFLGYSMIVDQVAMPAAPVALTYQYGLIDKLAVGVMLKFATTSGTLNNGTKDYTIRTTGLAACLKADYHYLNSKKADLYSGLAVGWNQLSFSYTGVNLSDYSNSLVSFSANLLGFRYMFTPNIGAYAEAGWSRIGMVTVGVSGRFGK